MTTRVSAICFGVSAGVLLCVTALGAEDVPANLIYNASFELGLLKDWWGIMFPNARFVPENISDEHAVHGKRSLTFLGPVRFFSRYLSLKQTAEYRFRFWVKASAAGSGSVFFRAKPPPSEDKGASERILAAKNFPVTKDWRRHELSVHLSEGDFALLISLSSESPKPRFWLDAFELSPMSTAKIAADLTGGDEEEDEGDDDIFVDDEEQHRLVTAFPVEAGLLSDVPGHIFYRGDESRALLAVFSNSARPQKIAVRYEIRDIDDRVVKASVTNTVSALPGRLTQQPFALPAETNGQFSLQYWLDGKRGSLCEFVYSVVEKPKTETILGAHTYADDYHLSVLARANVRWYVSLTDSFLRAVNVHPEPDKYVWDDARGKRLRAYGMRSIGVLEHSRFPEWGAWTTKKLEHPVLMRGGYFESRRYVREDLWEDHVRTIVSHYKDTFRRWIIDDEIHAGWDPRGYLPILQRTRKLLREIIPDAEVTTSAAAHWFEEFIDIAGPDSFDALCGSIGNASVWEKRKTRFLSEKYDKPVWVNALFGYSRTAYRTHRGPGTLDRLDRAVGIYRHMLRNFFVQRASYVSPYIFRLTKHSTTRPMPKSMLDYDGGLMPHGFGFVHAGNRLAAEVEENLGALELKQAVPVEAYAFTGHGRAGVFLMGAARVSIESIDGMELTDWLGRARELAVKDGRITLQVSRAPITLTAPEDRAQHLFEAVRGLEVATRVPTTGLHVTERFAYQDGALVVEAHITNHSNQRTLYPTSAEKSIGVEPGQTAATASPIRWLRSRPLDNHLTGRRNRLWLHNCMKRGEPIETDGDLSDWPDRSASWITMSWDVLGFYARRQLQLVKGGEHMSYEPRRDCKLGFRSMWDDAALYFAVTVADDSVPSDGDEADRVILEFREMPIREVCAGPHLGAVAVPGDWKVEVGAKLTPTGYQLEIKVPMAASGSRLHQIIPFDLYVHDVDKDEKYTGDDRHRWGEAVMQWASHCSSGGQLIFTDRHKPVRKPVLAE